MKQLAGLLLIFTILNVSYIFAQQKPATPMLEVGYLIPLEEDYAFRFRAILSKPISPNFNLGVGFGTENYKGNSNSSFVRFNFNTFPVFADIRYFVLKSDKSPFIFSNAGYSLKLGPNFEKGLMAAAGVGYRLNVGKSTFQLSTGFNYQELSNRNISIKTVPVQVGFIF